MLVDQPSETSIRSAVTIRVSPETPKRIAKTGYPSGSRARSVDEAPLCGDHVEPASEAAEPIAERRIAKPGGSPSTEIA